MLPLETINAVFPPSVRIGKTSIGPMTLYHAVALEALGIECRERNTNDSGKSAVAAWILSRPANEMRGIVNGGFNSRTITAWTDGIGQEEAVRAVDRVFSEAFSTFVPPADEDKEVKFDDMPDGFGWPLEIAETIAHEHGIGVEEALGTPVVRAFALQAVMRQRYGGKFAGSDYYGRIREKRVVEMARAAAKIRKQGI